MATPSRTPGPLDRAEIPGWLDELNGRQEGIRVVCMQQRRRAVEMRMLALKLRRDATRSGFPSSGTCARRRTFSGPVHTGCSFMSR